MASSVRDAILAGIRYIDTAVYYGTEAIIGDTLQVLFKEGTVQRENLFIIAKVYNHIHRKMYR